MAGITESRGAKSDKRDAYGLAEKLRVGDLDKSVFKASRQFTRLRELSRIHMTLVGDVVRAQSRIKSLYRSRGILVSGMDVYGVRPREDWQKQLGSSAQTRAMRLYDHLDLLLEQKKQAESDLLREASKHAIVRILETAPGIGPIQAARLVPIVVTPHRFRTKRQFWSYCGLGIVTRSSADWIQTSEGSWVKARAPQTRGLSRQHDRFLKHLFKGAATTVVTQRNKDPIDARYQRLLDGGTKPTLAKLSLARMIAATVLRMWKDEEEYDPSEGRLSPGGYLSDSSLSDFAPTARFFLLRVTNSDDPHSDHDGSNDGTENCRLVANANQADSDGDGVGNVRDNCTAIANPTQLDAD